MSSLPFLTELHASTFTQAQQYVVFFIALIGAAIVYSSLNKRKHPPVINPPKLFDFTGGSNKVDFLQRSYEIINDTSRTNNDRPYTVIADVGTVIVLPPKFAEEIKNHPQLDFMKNVEQEFHGSLPGFEVFNKGLVSDVLIQVAKKQLTKSLNKITAPLSKEAAYALYRVLGDPSEWKEVGLQGMTLSLVAQLSSRVFLGEKLCRNPEWLDVTSQYPPTAFNAAQQLRLYPKPLQPLVNWFLPECRLLRRQQARARSMIVPVIEERKAEKRRAIEAGQPVPVYDDAIDWAEEEAKRFTYEPAHFQLAMSNAAIHTTSDLLSQTLLEILAHPELIQPLRNEITEVLRIHGWTKVGLYNLKLMDSIMKETQRMKPIQMVTMQRVAVADVHLSDGSIIPKGAKCAVANTSRLDDGIYKEPKEFDGYRFLNMRNDAGNEHSAQLVTTSPDSLGFGHGTHSCPGRFFAANELKVAICHLILKYDLELSAGTSPEPFWYGWNLNANLGAKIRVRRRKEEIDIDGL
ncbi:cytochrome P450 [Xylaria bambusicola]|uniref:cytochrome P450 n=1 Tax=Xylaria bambusicola TaxID=326684 RepID=UPI00200878C5|nr:cytochrome P450 [Xylaria bambusicola]KAI0527714.1 cytochrome P450 [Xylaria bambusicola]